jgi:hypothetical protein
MPLVKPLARTRSVATDDSLTIADSKSRRGLNPAAFYVLLGNKLFHLRLHPCQERFSRSRPYPGPLKLEDFLALSTNLRAHALDFRAEYSSVGMTKPGILPNRTTREPRVNRVRVSEKNAALPCVLSSRTIMPRQMRLSRMRCRGRLAQQMTPLQEAGPHG